MLGDAMQELLQRTDVVTDIFKIKDDKASELQTTHETLPEEVRPKKCRQEIQFPNVLQIEIEHQQAEVQKQNVL